MDNLMLFRVSELWIIVDMSWIRICLEATVFILDLSCCDLLVMH